MKQLILTEKPSVARDFAKALQIPPHGSGFYEGKQHIITWAIGHLLQPLYPEEYDSRLKKWLLASLPIIIPRLSFKPNPKTAKQLAIISSLLQRDDVNELLIATDAGREGELIARTILSHAKNRKPSFRFWTSQALSPEVITQTIKEKRELIHYDRLYHAGLARQYADWLVGINLTRMATIKFGDLYSIGRVQTAVLALLVNRHHQINQFTATTYWHLQLQLQQFEALWFDPSKKENAHIIESKEIAEKIQKKISNEATVTSITQKTKKERPPSLFSLTELQQSANKLFGFSAKKTLDLAQELYEKDKALSYPRTDATVLGSSSFKQISELLNRFETNYPHYFKQYDANKLKITNKDIFDDQKLTDHHALIPLKVFKGDGDKAKIFELVLKRFLSAFSLDFVFNESTVILQSASEYFKSKGTIISQHGWKELDQLDKEKKLPPLKKLQVIPIKKINCLEKKNPPPPQYTESSLLRDMINPAKHVEDKKLKKIFRGDIGLGTQATRAQIIETLLERQYIVRDKRKMLPTDKGIFLIDTIKNFHHCGQLANPSETAKWEEALELISQGSGDVKLFVEQMRSFVSAAISEWKEKKVSNPNQIASCPFCQDGDIIEQEKSYSCNQWKQGCKFTVWKNTAGKKITKLDLIDLINNKETKTLRGFKSKKGNVFDAKLTIQGKQVVLHYVDKE